MNKEKRTEFEAAGEEKELSLLGEFLLMLRENKKYWMIPLLILLLGFGLLLVLGSSPAIAPFIYTLF
ncbi:DUF5989 family protein [Fontisphaera persica]|jgi:DUF917 family protein|uniref:DUF5989 family protein n=1 Tax=Fontisphaera persica TaxID=2974023 RepID=UPI0024C05665|nr:DUF5989 family protein [Fontisphaera persica]WCJ60658.1 DUF5989 family protein [Fontisphaera persica]